jgi:hypothetical protein
MTPANLRALLWACLLDNDPGLTLKKAGELVDGQNMAEVVEAINLALLKALPGAKKNSPLARESQSG